MTNIEVKEMCKRMGIVFDEEHPDHITTNKLKTLTPPFMEYILTDKPVYADGKRYLDIKELVIRIYSDTETADVEKNVQEVLEEEDLRWKRTYEYIEGMKIGDFEAKYFSELSSAANAVSKIMGPGNTVVAERVQGVLNAINTQLKYQKNVAQRQDVRAILFEDLDPSSSIYGALAIGTQGFQIADKRTADGREWDWTTAFTAKGGYADVLIAGILSDRTGRSFWNLDTGEIQLTGVFRQFADNGYKSVDIQNNQICFYGWESNGDCVGRIGATRRGNDGRMGVEMWCEPGDMLWLGYDLGTAEVDHIRTILSFDSKTPEQTPYIINTATGKIFPKVQGGGIVVENGLIKSWDIGSANGTLYLGGAEGYKDIKVTVTNGLITGWEGM